MKIAVYSPYLDTAGGGEKYMMSIAEFLSQTNEVDVLLDTNLEKIGKSYITSRLENLHGLNLSRVNFTNAPFGYSRYDFRGILKRLLFLKKYDFLFYLTDGSIFYSTAKKSIIHLQAPLKNLNTGPWGRLKFSSWKLIIYNSKFTKKETENSWGIKGEVVYPPVPVDEIKPLKKEKIILSVGRFFGYLKDKKHKLMIYRFLQLLEQNKLPGWSLHLAGGAGDGDKNYLDELNKISKGKRVFLHPNIGFNDLLKLYGTSLIYWHCAGYGEKDPTRMEHFGISTVEAMAGGCIPVVINLGGQKEIVEHGKTGYLWDTTDEMVDFTLKIIKEKNLAEKLSKAALERSRMFSKEKFCQNILKILNG